MPLALLIQSAISTLRRVAGGLSPWIALVEFELKLVERARGAFLTHWWGASIPLRGDQLRIAISNLDALRERYRAVTQRGSAGEANVIEPLAGLGGQVIGIALSPTGVFLIAHQLWRRVFGGAGTGLLALLLEIVTVPVIYAGAVAAGLGTLLSRLARPARSSMGLPTMYALAGALTGSMREATTFVDQLLGSRSAVRNPLVRQVLILLDGVAALFAQLLGTWSVLVARIGPQLRPLVTQALLLWELITAVLDLLRESVKSTRSSLMTLVADERGSPFRVVRGVLGGIMAIPARVLGLIRPELTRFTNLFGNVAGNAALRLALWAVRVAGQIARALLSQPIVRTLLAGADRALLIGGMLPASPPRSAPPPATSAPASGSGTSPIVRTIITATVGPTALTPPVLPPLPSTSSLTLAPVPSGTTQMMAFRTALLVRDFALVRQFAANIRARGDRLRRSPESIFAQERRSLAADAAALTEVVRAGSERIDTLLSVVVGRLAPPELRAAVLGLSELFENFATIPQFPVRDLPDNGQLRLVVHRLRVRAADPDEVIVRTFTARLTAQLRAQPYRALAET